MKISLFDQFVLADTAEIYLGEPGESGLYESDINVADYNFKGMVIGSQNQGMASDASQTAYGFYHTYYDNLGLAKRSVSNGIYKLKADGSIWPNKAPISFDFKLSEDLIPGVTYRFQLDIVSENGTYIDGVVPAALFYSHDVGFNSLCDKKPTAENYGNERPILYVADTSIKTPNKAGENMEFVFTIPQRIDADGYICLRMLTAYGASDTLYVAGANLSKSGTQFMAGYNGQDTQNVTRLLTNMDQTFTSQSGTASGKTALKKYYKQAIAGVAGFTLEDVTDYSVKLLTTSAWSGCNVSVYAFPHDASFSSVLSGKLIAKLGNISPNDPNYPGEYTFKFTTLDTNIDYSVYDTLTIVYDTVDNNSSSIILYELNVIKQIKANIVARALRKCNTSRTFNSITIEPVWGADYGIMNSNGDYDWQQSNIFRGLSADSEYKFSVQRSPTVQINGYSLEGVMKTEKCGDQNLDNIINIVDLIRLKKILSGEYPLQSNTDVDGDGDITSVDLVLLKRILLGVPCK